MKNGSVELRVSGHSYNWHTEREMVEYELKLTFETCESSRYIYDYQLKDLYYLLKTMFEVPKNEKNS